MPFSQMMGVPLELSLRETKDGLRVFAEPVKELDVLRGRAFEQNGIELKPGEPLKIPLEGQLYDLDVSLECPADAEFKIRLGKDEVVCSGKGLVEGIPVSVEDGKMRVRVLVDRPLVEIIANGGEFYLPRARKGQGEDFTIELIAQNAPVKITSLRAYEMKSIWKP